MKFHTLAAAAMALTFVSMTALAAPSAPPPPSGPDHLDEIGAIKGTADTCTALENRFDEYAVSREAHRQPGVTDAIALRDEGARLCREGMVRPGAIYLRSAISTLMGKTPE